MKNRGVGFFIALGTHCCSRFRRFSFVLVSMGALAAAPEAFGQGQFVFTNYWGSLTNPVGWPPLRFPADSGFDSGIILTGAPVTVAGTNQVPQAVITVQWWHWTAPADGVADLNAAPLYATDYVPPPQDLFSTNIVPIPLGYYRLTQTWPQISVGPDRSHLTVVPLLPFSQSTVVSYTLFPPYPAFPPLYLPDDRLPWQHKFRFPVIAGQTYHIALTCAANGTFQFGIDVIPVGLLALTSGSTNPVVGDPFPVEFISANSNRPVVSLEAFGGTNSLGGATNEPFQFVYTPSQPGPAAIYALGTNSSGERVVAFPIQVTFRPANDDFARATIIPDSLTLGSFSADVSSATTELGESEISPSAPASHSVWWRWTARYGVRTTVTLTTSDSKLEMFKGADIGSLQKQLELEKPPAPFPIFPEPWGGPQTTSFFAEPGVTYYIRGTGSGIVSWSLEQQTLELHAPSPQRGNVGWPLDFSAVFYETDNPPFQVEFFFQQYPGILSGTLGSFDAPPFAGSWTPAEVGPYFIWARSTSSNGIVHQTQATQFDVYAENDDFLRATVIAPDTIATNFVFDNLWCSAETNEPPHGLEPVQVSRWWKWTPSWSGSIRLKAVRNGRGIPVDVFTGTSLTNLRRIANNDKQVYIPGYSAIVRFKIQAGTTYLIRVDDSRWTDTGMEGPFYESSPYVTFTLEPSRVPLPGELLFSLMTFRGGLHNPQRVIPLAQVFLPGGRVPVVGSSFWAQLWAGSDAAQLQPVGLPQPFYDEAFAAQYGYGRGEFVPISLIVPNTVAGHRVSAQVRVWDSNAGSSYEDALANGGLTGRSKIISVIAGSEEVGPARLLGIENFSLQSGPR